MEKLKKDLRKIMKEKREKLKADNKEKYDITIFHNLIHSDEYKKARTIFIYVSYNNEADTHRIICHALENNKIVCVPKVISKAEGMKAVEIKSFMDLIPGSYGILEPGSNCFMDEKDIDLVILPGLAFDSDGGRLGYGAGFYDRFLCSVREDAMLVGLSYKFQVVEKVPMDSHDYYIKKIITD